MNDNDNDNDKDKHEHGLREVLSQLMLECDIDDASLSRQTDVPASTISRMRLIPEANPTAATLRPIAKFFDISISQLLGDEPLAKERLPGTHNPIQYTASLMPVIEWGWVDAWVENKTMPSDHSNVKWISSEHKVGEKAFALTIPTETFGLFLRKGSIILMDPTQTPKDGDIILFRTPGEKSIFLRQVLIDGNNYYIRSINPELKGIEPLGKDYRLLGVLVETRFSPQEDRATNSLKTTKTISSPAGTVLQHSL